MSNFENFKSVLALYGGKFYAPEHIETSLKEASYDSSNKVSIYNGKELTTINTDGFAQYVYSKINFPKAVSTTDIKSCALASADAFLIDKDGQWFLIEFKNQEIKNTKESVEKKAYQNFFWLSEIFFKLKDLQAKHDIYFDASNPFTFAKENITYILVVSEEKNSSDIEKMHTTELANLKFRTPFMEKLRNYLYKDAYIYTPKQLERLFVKEFEY